MEFMKNGCSRRQFLKKTAFSLAATALGPQILRAASSSGAKRPNIILIMSDDMGYSDIGCYGSEIKTPTLDNLAANGLRFKQFYNTARCCPTRGALLTGLYSHQAGIGHMMEERDPDAYQGDLNNHCVTIAEVMKGAGYATYMTGKWHVTKHRGKNGPKFNWPLQRGFDKFYGTITGAGNFYDPANLTRDNTAITPVNDPEYKTDRYYYTDAIADNATRYVSDHFEQGKKEPFFMYMAFTAAHWPMHALEEDIAKYKGKYDNGYTPIRKARLEKMKKLGLVDDRWELSPQAGDWSKVEHKEWESRCMEVYAAMIDRMDQGIAKVVNELKKRGEFDNTLIFFLQDNGACAETLGRGNNPKQAAKKYEPMGPDDLQTRVFPPMQTRDGRAIRTGPMAMPGPADTYIAYGKNWANVSNTPFRMYKHWEHEGGISSPLIVHWPDGFKAKNEFRSEPSHLIDIMATCVDVAGATYPMKRKGSIVHPMEGVSLTPVFENKPLDRKVLYWEHEGNRAVRMGKWKLVSSAKDNPMRWDRDNVLPEKEWRLFDIDADRTEMHDLSAKYPDRVKKMAKMWKDWAMRVKAVPKPYKD